MLQLVIGRLSKSIFLLKMNSCTIRFLLLAFCQKCVWGKLPISRNWYISPMLWPIEHSAPRYKLWSSANTRYGRHYQSPIVKNNPYTIALDKYRSGQNDLRTLILRNTNMPLSPEPQRNHSMLQASTPTHGVQQSYSQLNIPFPTAKTTAQTLGDNSAQSFMGINNVTSFSRNLKFCKRDPAFAQSSLKVHITKSTLLPNSPYDNKELRLYSNRYQNYDAHIKVNKSSEQYSFDKENSHSFFTLNDAVTPSFKTYQDFERNRAMFVPTIIATTESQFKPVEYNETPEPGETNTSAQKLLPLNTENSTPDVLTTEYLISLPTGSSPPADTTISTTELATTLQPNSQYYKKQNRNSTQTQTSKRYIKETKSNSARSATQKNRIGGPRLKLKSKHEFFRQVRFGNIRSSLSPQLETQSNYSNSTEIVPNTTIPSPTRSKSTKISTKRMRVPKYTTSTIATQMENYIPPTKMTEPNVSKQRNAKRYFRKSNTKLAADKSQIKISSTASSASSTSVLPSKIKEHLKLENSQKTVKSTQSTIMKIYGNKNNAENTKFALSSMESNIKSPKKTHKKINVQPLPIEIIFQNQQLSTN